MFKWFREQLEKSDIRANKRVVTALEKYREVPVDKKFKRRDKLEEIFVAIMTAKGYGTVKADYIGGYYLMEEPKKGVKITIVDNTLIFKYEDGILIDIDRIKEVTLNSREQIRHRVTVTRLVTAGVLALAIPKREAEILQYLVIKFIDTNNKEQEIVLAGENLGNLHSVLYSRIENKGA